MLNCFKHEKNYVMSWPGLYLSNYISGTYTINTAYKHFPSALKQGSHRLEKYLNLEGFLEKSLKIKSALKSTGNSFKSLEKSLNSTIFYRT